MRKNSGLFTLFLILLSPTLSYAADVTVVSPGDGATVSSPFHLQASAPTCEGKVTSAMGYSLEKGGAACHAGLKILVSGGTDTEVAPAVSPASNIPVPPSSAKLAAKIQELDGWKSHTGAASQCPNGVASATCHPISANFDPLITHPADPTSLSGGDGITGKFELHQGPPHATAIWGHTVLKDPSARNLIWDFYVYTDSRNYGNLELDLYEIADGQRFMLGMQCDRGKKSWDTWNEGQQHWIHNPQIPCDSVLPPSTWHRVVLYASIDSTHNTYTYHTLRIDGVDYSLNQTEPAKSVNWPNGSIGVQLQLDANSAGDPVAGYVEKMQIYAW